MYYELQSSYILSLDATDSEWDVIGKMGVSVHVGTELSINSFYGKVNYDDKRSIHQATKRSIYQQPNVYCSHYSLLSFSRINNKYQISTLTINYKLSLYLFFDLSFST